MTTDGQAAPQCGIGRLPASALAIVGALLVLVTLFCVLLWPEWRQNPDLSHGFFAPLIFLLLVRESRRQGPHRWLPAGRLPALALAAALSLGFALFALAGVFAASLAWTHALVSVLLGASLVFFLFSGLLILADERWRIVPLNWISVVAVFFWLLVTPMPDGTYARVTFALQGWVTSSVLHTLQILGVPARQHGNVIELARTTVGVEEACSGIRSLLSCIFAGFFFSAWQVRRTAGRVALIVIAPLLALGMNFLRSLTLTLLANNGTEINGFWHDATGFAILGITAILLAGLAILLESKSPPAAEAPFPAGKPAAPVWPARAFWSALAATSILATFYYVNSRPKPGPPAALPQLSEIVPASATGWKVLTANDLYQFSDILRTNHLIERTYIRSAGGENITQLTVYVAYWEPGQASVSRVASHTPDACWPGSGWIAQPHVEAREVPQVAGLSIAPAEHRVFVNQAGYPQHVWFWHVYDGRVINYRDPYSVPALFHLALKYGFRRQGDQFFVRISSNKPWADVASESLVHEILTNLSHIGL